MRVNDFIFSRITIVLGIIMILSIPALCIWPLFHTNAGEVSYIMQDSIEKEDGEKVHSVWFKCGDESKHERYTISSKREMSLYNKLRDDGIYMRKSIALEITYTILWFVTLFCVCFCMIDDLFTNDLYDSEKKRLAEFYTKIIKGILKFLGHDPEKVESLELTIQYNERLSFIDCFTQLAHSLQE